MPHSRRQLIYLFLGAFSIAGGLTMGNDRPAAGQSALETDTTGWTDIMPDEKLTGWTRLPVPAEAPLGRAQWHMDGDRKHLVCEGDGGQDWLRYDRELDDFILHAEWRYTPVDGGGGYNSGIYVRTSPDGRVWHQAQVGDRDGGFFFGQTLTSGQLRRFNLADDLREQRVLRAGQWNTYEITCRGGMVVLWVNGVITNVWNGCETARGFLGVAGEGARIEFRNLKLKEL
jgi:hypothetical protein